jgi:hypothetical protein
MNMFSSLLMSSFLYYHLMCIEQEIIHINFAMLYL